MFKSERQKIIEEERCLRADIEQIRDSYREMDLEFNKWKEGVLQFEHSEYCIDDHSGSDDRIRDGQCVRTAEDEDDFQRSSEQVDQ